MDSTDVHANVRSVTCLDHSFGGDGHSGKGWGLWDGNFISHRIHVWYIIGLGFFLYLRGFFLTLFDG